MAWTTVCRLEDLFAGEGKYVEIDGHRLAVFLDGDGGPRVTDDACPHAGYSLSAGHVDRDGCAVCPLHGWAFDLRTGSLRGGASEDEVLVVYPTRVLDGTFVQADLPMP